MYWSLELVVRSHVTGGGGGGGGVCVCVCDKLGLIAADEISTAHLALTKFNMYLVLQLNTSLILIL